MPPDAPYAPPLTLTPALLNRVAAIAEALGRWSARQDALPSPRLRRENRIHTIQASLAIEQNSLSIEQVSALFDGQRVIGPARDIQEVRNAIAAYDALPRWDPANHEHLLAAHGLLMAGLIDAPGRFRRGGVGIYRGDQLVHMAPPAARVPGLVGDLLAWLAASAWHPLLVSCVAHYELEFIHPFADGNGRLDRLWQTLILSRWNPLLAWLPIEEVIRSRQQGYDESLGQADQPLAVIELKNPADHKADIWAAFKQLQTYKQDIPDLFTPNVLLVISDGIQARYDQGAAETL
jgi:Fic family protein